jgi:hypothetical protein
MKIFRRRQLSSGSGVSVGAGAAESWFIVRCTPGRDHGLEPEDIVSTGHVFLVFMGGDGARRRPEDLSGFRKRSGTISIDGPLKSCRIGRVVPENPGRCSSTRAQAAILKWNCGICNFGPRNFSLLIKLPSAPTNIMRESWANIV